MTSVLVVGANHIDVTVAVAAPDGKTPTKPGTGRNGKLKEPAFIIAPVMVTKANWRKLYTSKFLKKSDICNGSFKKYC